MLPSLIAPIHRLCDLCLCWIMKNHTRTDDAQTKHKKSVRLCFCVLWKAPSESNPLNRPYLWPYPSTVTGKCEGTTPNVLSRWLISCSQVMACTSLAFRRTQRKNGNNSGYPAVSKFLEASSVSTPVGSISSNRIILRIQTNWIRYANCKQPQLHNTWIKKIGLNGICSMILSADILVSSAATNWKVPLQFVRHSRSQNFAAAPTPPQFSTAIIRNNLCL